MAAEAQFQLAKGRIGIPGETPTFTDYATQWISYIEAVRAPRTVNRYRELLKKILPCIGKKQIDKITRDDVRELLIKEYKNGAAKAIIELTHTVLSGIFNHAIDDELIDKSPTYRIMAKIDIHSENEEIRPLSSKEMQKVLRVIETPIFRFSSCHLKPVVA